MKFKVIAEDVAYHAKQYCQEPLVIERIVKDENDYIFCCRRFPKGGLNSVFRIIEMMNEHYEFDPKRATMDFAEPIDSGFLFRCCWNTHTMNKKYRKEAYDSGF